MSGLVSTQQYIYVHNIPSSYHACHLRNFFSQFVESSRFICFHFRHRPSLRGIDVESSQIACSVLLSAIRDKQRDLKGTCGFAVMSAYDARELNKRYHQTHWLSVNSCDQELPLSECCYVMLIMFDDPVRQLIDIQSFMEFKPPNMMPAGNVGTPTSHFFNLIKSCQLDSTVISKLKLDFSITGKRGLYSAVPYCYDCTEENAQSLLPGEVRSLSGTRILSMEEYDDHQAMLSVQAPSDFFGPATEGEQVDDDNLPEPEEACEEWERFESLHDDPYKLERRDKANLKYEDKIELVWEKGGSGLVFHTDERTWRKLDPLRKEEIFDEPASLDWDIDMDIYENPNELGFGPSPAGNWGAFRDTADLIDIQRARESIEPPSTALSKVDPLLNNYGLRLMRRMGWRPGMRLGRDRSHGLLTPITSDGSLPRVRHGLGYYGNRLDRQRPVGTVAPNNSGRPVYIRTAFDSPDYVASRCGLGVAPRLLCREDPDQIIKYRTSPSMGPLKSECANANPTPTNFPRNRTVILIPHQSLSKEGITFVPGGVLNPK